MADIQQWLRSARKRYLEAKELIDRQSEDLEKEPYKLKYKAAEILRELRNGLNKFEDKNQPSINVVRSLLEYELGAIAYDTEEPCTCDEHHKKCWELVKDHAIQREYVCIAINVLNSLGILRASRGEREEARDFLKRAEILYGEYKLGKNECPYKFEDLFILHDDTAEKSTDWRPFEKAVTHTLYYLAQVFEHLGDNESSAKYCHITLKRQMDSKEYDPLDWAVNCANMSQYFAAKEKFNIARHVLACASFVMKEYEEKLKSEEKSNDDDDDKWENYEHGLADISICWAKYALMLLATSLDKKIVSVEGNCSTDNSENGGVDVMKAYRLLSEAKIKDLENQITCDIVTNSEQAKCVFPVAVKFLEQAKSYYVLNSYTYDYVRIIQDNSKLYKLLAGFESDKSRQCKMHKRRINMLEDILKRLSQQHYLALCQQIIFELAEIYSEMVDLKISIANNEGNQITAHAVKKINFLVSKSIEYYKSFIDTIRDSKKKLPETFAESTVRPVLVAHFCLGRLYSKLIVPDRNQQIEYLKLSENSYNFVIEYVKKNPQHEASVMKELPVIKEMAELLPLKMRSLMNITL